MRTLWHQIRLIHSCGSPGRLLFALRGACEIIVVFIMLLLGKQCEMLPSSCCFLVSRVRPYKVILAALQAGLSRHYCHSFGLLGACESFALFYASNPTTQRDCHHSRSQTLVTSLLSYNIIVVHCGTRAVFSFTRLFL
jgi:hypothetical protein